MGKRYFGTDGIRGKVGDSPITPEFVLHLGWAVGHVLASHGGRGKVVIGKDTRISGYMFESALQAGLSAAGVDIRLLGPMPTPGIAYLTRTMRADAGLLSVPLTTPILTTVSSSSPGLGSNCPMKRSTKLKNISIIRSVAWNQGSLARLCG